MDDTNNNMNPTTTNDKQPRRKRAKKPAGMPKRPLSAYNLFFQEQKELIMAKHKNAAKDGSGEAQDADFHLQDEQSAGSKGPAIFRALAKCIGQRWKALPDEERQIYQTKAQLETAKYREKMDDYHRNMVKVQQQHLPNNNGANGGGLSLLDNSSTATSRKGKKPADMPKRPLSAYNLFFKHEKDKIMQAQRSGEPQADFCLPDEATAAQEARAAGKRKTPAVFQALARCIGKRWKALDTDQRKIFQDQAELETKAYRQKMEDYNKNLLVTQVGNYQLPSTTTVGAAAREDEETRLSTQDERRADNAAATPLIDNLVVQQQQQQQQRANHAPQIAAFGTSAMAGAPYGGGLPYGGLLAQQQQQANNMSFNNNDVMAYLRANMMGQLMNGGGGNARSMTNDLMQLNAPALLQLQQQQQQQFLQQQYQQQQQMQAHQQQHQQSEAPQSADPTKREFHV